MSKYLIGVIPSLFLLVIACFARATPVEQVQQPISLHAPAVLISSSAIQPEKHARIK